MCRTSSGIEEYKLRIFNFGKFEVQEILIGTIFTRVHLVNETNYYLNPVFFLNLISQRHVFSVLFNL